MLCYKLASAPLFVSKMALEVLEGDPATEAADIYAVGVIAYELFAGGMQAVVARRYLAAAYYTVQNNYRPHPFWRARAQTTFPAPPART